MTFSERIALRYMQASLHGTKDLVHVLTQGLQRLFPHQYLDVETKVLGRQDSIELTLSKAPKGSRDRRAITQNQVTLMLRAEGGGWAHNALPPKIRAEVKSMAFTGPRVTFRPISEPPEKLIHDLLAWFKHNQGHLSALFPTTRGMKREDILELRKRALAAIAPKALLAHASDKKAALEAVIGRAYPELDTSAASLFTLCNLALSPVKPAPVVPEKPKEAEDVAQRVLMRARKKGPSKAQIESLDQTDRPQPSPESSETP